MNRKIILLIFAGIGFGLSYGFYYLSATPKSISAKSLQRIICFNPAAVEVIFKIGAGDKVIGVSSFCDYLKIAGDKERVGESINPDFEKISKLSPDMIIVMGRSRKIRDYCKVKGYKFLSVNMRTVDELYRDIKMLGEKLDCRESANSLAETMQQQMDLIRSKTAALKKEKVFLCLYRPQGQLSGLTTVGGDTMLDELIEIAGGVNIFGDVKIGYPKVSKETILKRQPDIIIEPVTVKSFSPQHKQQALQDWSKMDKLPAVKNGRVYFPDADLLLRPGINTVQAARAIAEILHPEVFK